ncbi:MAG: hypothetical protein NTZ63_03265 [Candidatus Omnitrophica bacterium]|nr:hypothetical protein [Candidatus Omnitrophota bacterium]
MEKKIYEKTSEKVIDFLVGFLIIPGGIGLILYLVRYLTTSFHIFNPLGSIGYPVFLILSLLLVNYFGKKRKYIGIGFLFAMISFPLVLLGTCFLKWFY